MPTGTDIDASSAVRVGVLARFAISPEAALFAAALPLLFLHDAFQPSVDSSLGSTDVQARLSDLMIVVIAAAAALAAHRHGAGRLRRGAPVWIAAGLFLAWTFAATFYPLATNHAYPWQTHLVTAVKYAEYAVIAIAVPLVLRTLRDVALFVWVLVGVSAAATVVAIAQFFGLDVFRAWPPGGRQPAFVGVDDLGMLSAAAFTVAIGVIAVGRPGRPVRALAWVAGAAGVLGLVVAGSLAAVLGALLAVLAAAAVARRSSMLDVRRAALLAAMSFLVLGGTVFMRSSALGDFARFAGIGRADNGRAVESYSHRLLLDYVGLKMFLRDPITGAGWQAGFDESGYGPVLAAAHRRFPLQPAQAFPSPAHPWGIQSAYVEVLGELGFVGAALFLAWILAGFRAAVAPLLRARAPAPPALLALVWLCVVLGVWNALWFIGGAPFDVLIWLAFGLAAAPPLLPAEGAR